MVKIATKFKTFAKSPREASIGFDYLLAEKTLNFGL